MPVGIPKAGYRRSKKLDNRTLADIERELAFKVPDFVKELERISKPLNCPQCGHQVKQADKDAIIYLIDRAMGKPTQKQELDITQRVELNADQVDKLLWERFNISISDVQAFIEARSLLNEGKDTDSSNNNGS